MSKKISLSQDKFAIVDDEDFEKLNQYNWFASGKGQNSKIYYARRHVKNQGNKHMMHRQIMGLRIGDKRRIDHINNNGLDNRKENLRFATVAQNNRNRGPSKNNETGYKGTRKIKSGRYQAFITLGIFNTPEEAAKIHDKAAKIFHGEFAWLNFPEELEALDA